MPCIEVPLPPVPTIPGIFAPVVNVPPIVIGGDFCCKFSISDEPAVALFNAVVNAALKALGGEANSIIGAANAEILAIAMPIMRQLKALKVYCPLE